MSAVYGKLVVATVDSGGKGMVVIDAGWQLSLIHTDAKTASDLQHKIGALVRAYAGNDRPMDGVVSELGWRIRAVERKAPERAMGLGF